MSKVRRISDQDHFGLYVRIRNYTYVLIYYQDERIDLSFRHRPVDIFSVLGSIISLPSLMLER